MVGNFAVPYWYDKRKKRKNVRRKKVLFGSRDDERWQKLDYTERIKFLRNIALKYANGLYKRNTALDGYRDLRKVRNFYKTKDCIVCGNKAQLMHHLRPLLYFGTNEDYNLVPLCQNCHNKVHPHLDKANGI